MNNLTHTHTHTHTPAELQAVGEGTCPVRVEATLAAGRAPMSLNSLSPPQRCLASRQVSGAPRGGGRAAHAQTCCQARSPGIQTWEPTPECGSTRYHLRDRLPRSSALGRQPATSQNLETEIGWGGRDRLTCCLSIVSPVWRTKEAALL